MYELARREAHQAERAFNFERGHTARTFIGCDHWDNLLEGLLAGERLQLDVARMEKEYLDLNCREYELTKHISLRLKFPLEFLTLKLTVIDVKAWTPALAAFWVMIPAWTASVRRLAGFDATF